MGVQRGLRKKVQRDRGQRGLRGLGWGSDGSEESKEEGFGGTVV